MSRRVSISLFIMAVLLLLVAHVADAQDGEDPLVGTNWWVEDILGGGVIDNSHTTIRFAESGRVTGDGGCNRYMGGYERDGESLSFGSLASTRKACPEAMMNQDDRFHQAMDRVAGWRIDPRTGLLYLLDGEGEAVLRAFRIKEGQEAPGEA